MNYGDHVLSMIGSSIGGLAATVARAAVVLFVVTCAAVGFAVDKVETATMIRTGKITKITPTAVTVTRGTQTNDVAVNEIVTIRFDGEPRDLNLARASAERGNYADARAKIDGFDDDRLANSRVREDVEYLTAYIAAREALEGQGDAADAGRLMLDFIQKYPQDYHYFAATELIARLLLASGRYDQAMAFADRLATAPWPEYQLKADNAKGQIHRSQRQFSEALAAYDAVLAKSADSDDEGVIQQRLLATLGKADCLAALERGEEGVALVTDVITATDAEDAPRQSLAYNTLGNCYRADGRTKEALLAFLHVDVLYSSQHDAHAEALANLVELWEAAHHAERSVDARERLEKTYPQSRWAQSR
jgi:tetratricopeptide (TPR) repeat protein